MNKVQKHNSLNNNTPSSESYRNYCPLGKPSRREDNIKMNFRETNREDRR